MRKTIESIKMILPALFLTGGICYGLHVHSGYEKGQREYASLSDEYTTIIEEPGSEGRTIVEENRDNDGEDVMQDKTMWKPLIALIPEDAPEKIAVRWEELKQKNDDILAWIYIPALNISYPVLQADDNEYYLHRDVNREYLYAGSIFMDAWNNPSFYNYNTIIYGHNMRDGSMFARLKDLTDPDILKECRYFWIFTPEADLLYEICSVHSALAGSETFTLRFEDYENYKEWQDKMLSLSDPPTGETLEYQDRVVTLSTCTDNSSVRMTVQGKLIWKTS